MLSMVFVMITMSIASAERTVKSLNDKSDITNPENPDHEVPDGSITFDHVTTSVIKKTAKRRSSTISTFPSHPARPSESSAEPEVRNPVLST